MLVHTQILRLPTDKILLVPTPHQHDRLHFISPQRSEPLRKDLPSLLLPPMATTASHATQEKKCSPSPLCTLCARAPETHMHFTQCGGYKTNSTSTLRDTINKISTRMQVDPGISSLLWQGLTVLSTLPQQLSIISLPPPYRPLAAQQKSLGWDQLWNGRWANRWGSSQLEDNPMSKSKRKKWIKTIKTVITRFLHQRWKERALRTGDDKHQLHKNSLLSQVESLYSKRRQFPLRYQFLFRTPMESLRQSPTPHLLYWMKKSGSLLQKFLKTKQLNQNGIRRFLTLCSYTRTQRNRSRRSSSSPLQRWEVTTKSRRKSGP